MTATETSATHALITRYYCAFNRGDVEGFMRGGYLALAGVRQPHTSAPGDEPAR